MIKLKYRVDNGKECWDEPYRTEINSLDLKDFAEKNRNLFQDRRILDLGCGQAYLRGRNDLGYISYTGLDNDLEQKPDILADYTAIPFQDESFDLVLALQIIPRSFSFYEVKNAVKNGGYFILQSGKFMFEKECMKDKIGNRFKIIEEIEYLIKIESLSRLSDHILENVFIVAKK